MPHAIAQPSSRVLLARRIPSRSQLVVPGFIAVRPRGLGILQGGQATAAQIASTGAVLTGTLVAAFAAIPIAGPIAAGIAALGMAIANAFSGCGQTCVAATSIANQVEPILDQNLQQYLSAPVHYASLQAAALNNFTTAWNALQQACSNPSLAAAGQRCITDRQAGACTWKASPGGWQQVSTGNAASGGVPTWQYQPWGAAGSGSACWNWFVGYHDPIAQDPTVVPDPSPISSAASSVSSAFSNLESSLPVVNGIPLGNLVLPAAAVLLLLMLLDS